MQRFLDWTANQTGSLVSNIRRDQDSNDTLNKQTAIYQHNEEPNQTANVPVDLEVQHLIKLLHEIKYYQASASPLPAVGSQVQREFIEKVHRTLPLFLNVFCNSNRSEHYRKSLEHTASVSGDVKIPHSSKSSKPKSQLDLQQSTSVSEKQPTSSQETYSRVKLSKFPDLLPFTFTIARLFVSEVRQLASNKQADEASLSILRYLLYSEPKLESESEEVTDNTGDFYLDSKPSLGWNLLLSLNTLAQYQDAQIINLLCDASLPSTLIKCLYLFFDLPGSVIENSQMSKSDLNLEKTQEFDSRVTKPKECNSIPSNLAALIRTFTQLLTKLCTNQQAIDELIKKDDLRLLVGIASGQCQSHNKLWKQTAFCTLLTISKNMKSNFSYLESNSCIQIYVENMHRMNSLSVISTEELIDMLEILVEFLYNLDVNNREQVNSISPLMKQMKDAKLTDIIEELMYKIDSDIMKTVGTTESVDSSLCSNVVEPKSPRQETPTSFSNSNLRKNRKYTRRIISIIKTLSKLNVNPGNMLRLSTLKPLASSGYEMIEHFKLPKPSLKHCILNHEALRLLERFWSKCNDVNIYDAILDAAISLFNEDQFNYFIFESQQLLVYFLSSDNFESCPYITKQKLCKFIEFIVFETNYIPCMELNNIGNFIKDSESDLTVAIGLRTLLVCLKFNEKFRNAFRQAGLVEVVTNLLTKIIHQNQFKDVPDKMHILYLLLEITQYLVSGPNIQNCVLINESGAARFIFNFLSDPVFFLLTNQSQSVVGDDPGLRLTTPPLSAHSVKSSHYPSYNPQLDLSFKPSIKQVQKLSLTIIRQLILSSSCDEHIANLLGLLARGMNDLKVITESDKTNSLSLPVLLANEISLKIAILKSLIIVLKDNHRCRTLFRKAGGFIYIISTLNILEDALPSISNKEIESDSLQNHNTRKIWRLIKNSLATIVVAMRSEPANCRVFAEDVLDKFTSTILTFGCFNKDQRVIQLKTSIEKTNDKEAFKNIFIAPPTRDLSNVVDENVKSDIACCQLFRFLYDMSLDFKDGTIDLENILERFGSRSTEDSTKISDSKEPSIDKELQEFQTNNDVFQEVDSTELKNIPKLRPPPLKSLAVKDYPKQAYLAYPSVILSLFDLLPSCQSDELVIFTLEIVETLLEHERNLRQLSEVGLITKLLSNSWNITLTNDNHYLHEQCSIIFEKLSSYSITERELKSFWRLEKPLRCENLDDIKTDSNSSKCLEVIKPSEKLSLKRIKRFVSMLSREKTQIEPAYTEFDMTTGESAFFFLPSIAPVNSYPFQTQSNFIKSTLEAHTSEKDGILGGVGTSVERVFPPTGGISFSTWFCIEKFPTPSNDSLHNIKLLTLYRASVMSGKEFCCLRVQISALDRSLLISTQETPLFDKDIRGEIINDLMPEANLRIDSNNLFKEGRWHHLVITLTRSVLKKSFITIYLDGEYLSNARISYISQYVGSHTLGGYRGHGSSGSANTTAAYVNMIVGLLPQYKLRSSTIWKQGPIYLIEETLSHDIIYGMYCLGPNYIGNFQCSNKMSELIKTRPDRSLSSDSPKSKYAHNQSSQQSSRQNSPELRSPAKHSNISMSTSGHHKSLISEEKIMVGLDARSSSLMTLSRMRRLYTRFDCRQVSRVLGLVSQENSLPIILLHNTSVHLNGPGRSLGAVSHGCNSVRCFVPSPTRVTMFNVGGSYLLLGLVAQSNTEPSLYESMKSIAYSLESNLKLQTQMDNINGYQILSIMLRKKKLLVTERISKLIFALVNDTMRNSLYDNEQAIESLSYARKDCFVDKLLEIKNLGAFKELICEMFDFWIQTNLLSIVLEFIFNQISISSLNNLKDSMSDKERNVIQIIRGRNIKYLRDMDLVPRLLVLLPSYDLKSDEDKHHLSSQQVRATTLLDNTVANTFQPSSPMRKDKSISDDGHEVSLKAIYVIKQIVFELLNKTSRQSDILFFGQFLASLLPAENLERPIQAINLRNILLKSLLQLMTSSKQPEVNKAMQEEFIRILGFDWFMLFINGSCLNKETLSIGFLNLMILITHDDIYRAFKNKTYPNGGWLKQPSFPSIDGRSNIQLLGVTVGVFFGHNPRAKSINQEVLNAPNLFALSCSLSNLVEMPKIYLMLFQTMMNCFANVDQATLDSIAAFDKLTIDNLCEVLVGDTHHKRRQALSVLKFKCHDLIVCIVLMIRDIFAKLNIMHLTSDDKISLNHDTDQQTSEPKDQLENFYTYPCDLLKFLMYFYNNHKGVQSFCKSSDDLIEALAEALMQPDFTSSIPTPSQDCDIQFLQDDESFCKTKPLTINPRQLIDHPAVTDILEFSRIIILDSIMEYDGPPDYGKIKSSLHSLEKFLEVSNPCREAQSCLVELLMRQILLTIDSIARHSNIKTMCGSSTAVQFQTLLANSILASDMIADKIWLEEIFTNNYEKVSLMIDMFLALTEQVFKFNEILPKQNPPQAYIMQRVINKMILFILSRPNLSASNKDILLDNLRKMYEQRTLIVLNHVQNSQSTEFFVCLTYCIINILDANTEQCQDSDTEALERSNKQSEGKEPSTSSRIVLAARDLWDVIYQSKKEILSEAFDVSLNLAAFTLETSIDLLQFKPSIYEMCQKYWKNYCLGEQNPSKKKIPSRLPSQKSSTSSSSTAANLLSGKLTRVVNAASFVSRVVGATAGSVASNVNLAEKSTKHENLSRSSTDLASFPSFHTSYDSNTQCSIDEISQFKCFGLNRAKFEKVTQTHVSVVEEYLENQLAQRNHKLALDKYYLNEWLEVEYENLLRECALFGPSCESKNLDKWCLDMTEGPRRMRKKMFGFTKQFYELYPYCPEQFNPSNKSLKYRPPMSFDSQLYYLKTCTKHQHMFDISENISSEEDNVKGRVRLGSSASMVKRVEFSTDTSDDCKSSNVEQSPTSCEVRIETTSPDKNETETKDNQRDTSSNILCNNERRQSISSLTSLTKSIQGLRCSMSPSGRSSVANSECGNDGDGDSFVDFSPEIEDATNSARDPENNDTLTVLRLLEKNEQISHMFRCSRVQGLDTFEGLLLFGKEHFYLIDGFTLLKTREIKDIDSLPPEAHDPIVPSSAPGFSSSKLVKRKKTCSKFTLDSVVEIHKRRYLLQPIALEVFSSDGRNILVVFPRNIRNKVYARLMSTASQLIANAHESLAGQKSNVSIEASVGLFSSLIGETSVTQRWVRGEISNFQYLMNLNTIAGRSYNDLMQYPIFPWILADYTSQELDLTNKNTFRDLSRPIGAQTKERLEQFKRRYSEWDDNETPPYHYGTFYSSAMIVASYMVRMEPFTQHFLRLQGGHFDLADRMFHSIGDAWQSASKHNMADIKELIPEFFYLPEFLTNSNKFDLGIKQNGSKLNDVILPPWAKNDPKEFIKLNRCALESEYVSAHLHEWIDLIFGCKQQGKQAVEAVNVFHHLFYEGSVDIYNADIDPIKKNAVIGFINNFGQVPKQLFKKSHPPRKVLTTISAAVSAANQSSVSSSAQSILPSALASVAMSATGLQSNQPKPLTQCPHLLRQTNVQFKELKGPVGQIVQIDAKNIVAVEQNKMLIPTENCRYISWGHVDKSIRLNLIESEKPTFVWENCDTMSSTDVLCCTIPNSRVMITGGTDSTLTVWRIEKSRKIVPITNLYGHVEPVTCLASNQSYSLLVSGSRDRTCIVWDLNKFTFVRQLGSACEDDEQQLVHNGPISAITINELTGDIATCASSFLYVWSINGDLIASIDTSLAVCFSMNFQSQSSFGFSVASSGRVHILSVCFSTFSDWSANEVIATGASDGTVSLWSLRYKEHIEANSASKQDSDEHERHESSNEEKLKDTSSAYEGKSKEDLDIQKPLDDHCQEKVDSEVDFNRTGEEYTNEIDEAIEAIESTKPKSKPVDIKPRKRTESQTSRSVAADWVKLSSSISSEHTAFASSPSDRKISESNDDGNLSSSLARELEFVSKSGLLLEGNEDIDVDEQHRVCLSSTPVTDSNINHERHQSEHDDSQLSFLDDDSKPINKIDKNSLPINFSPSKQLQLGNKPQVSSSPLSESFVMLDQVSTNKSQYQKSHSTSSSSFKSNFDKFNPISSSSNQQQSASSSTKAPTRQYKKLSELKHISSSSNTKPNSDSSGADIITASSSSSQLVPANAKITYTRELYLRFQLARRGPNSAKQSQPSAVTAITISRDHRSIFVGDAFGRITSFSIVN